MIQQQCLQGLTQTLQVTVTNLASQACPLQSMHRGQLTAIASAAAPASLLNNSINHIIALHTCSQDVGTLANEGLEVKCLDCHRL